MAWRSGRKKPWRIIPVIELATENADEIIRTGHLLEPTFGGINLEDIKAPTAGVALIAQGDILVGRFADRARPDFCRLMEQRLRERLEDRYAAAAELSPV